MKGSGQYMKQQYFFSAQKHLQPFCLCRVSKAEGNKHQSNGKTDLLNTQEVQASLLTARMENGFQQAGNRDSLVSVQLISTLVGKT